MAEHAKPFEEQLDDPPEGEIVIAENVTFEEFLKRFAEQHAEWINGAVILQPSKSVQHQQILGFLMTLTSLFLGFRNKGRVLLMGVPMLLSEHIPAREPDLLIVLNDHLDRIKLNYLDGPADIVVEIVSPESTDRDRGRKLREYEMGGVPEYWLIDPLRTESRVYALGDDGRYHPAPLDSEGRLASKVLPGFAVYPSHLWREQPPTGQELIDLAQQLAISQP